MPNINARIESEQEVRTYLQDLGYALEHGAQITFQEVRQVDYGRNIRHTNAYTVAKLFPDENPVNALRRELKSLTVEEYIRTVKDIRFPKRSEMREFVMSFHFAAEAFTPELFPYRK